MLSFNLPSKLLLFAIVMLLARKSKTNDTSHFHAKNGDLFKSANELVDSAAAELFPKNTTKIDKDGFMNKVFNLLNKYAIGVLCKEKIQIKMGENFQQFNEIFCGQLKEGKSIEEVARNLVKVAEKKEFAIDTTIFGGIQQKIQNLSFLNAKNKDGMEKFVGHFASAIKSFLGMIKANKLPFVIIANANNKNGRKSRRAKRDEGDTIITIDPSSGNNGGGTSISRGDGGGASISRGGDPDSSDKMIFSIFATIFCLGYALYYYFHLHGHTFDFILCAICAVICFIITLISCCCERK